MPTYVYETIPSDPSEEATQIEVYQSISADALTEHPETGQPVRRVITGGIALPTPNGCCSSGDDCCG